MNPFAPKIDNPLAAAAAHPLVKATKEQVAVTKDQPLVDYVRRSLELEEPEEIDRRANELTVIGYAKTADHLRERAATLRAARWRGRPPGASFTYRSPIPEASDEQWARFVRLMQTGQLAAVTPSGQLGLFQTRVKRLQDLGLARDVRRVPGEGAARWTATFKPPLTLARLLSDPLLQYRVFAASMRRYRGEILERHRDALGKEIEGKPATLSGLLAVAHHAGPGLASWLTNPEDRRRFQKTTAAYGQTTGVF
ncbi:MAG TPA: hypothetical protein VHJ20_00990 [Polyangia bacterium]|nr:hypothetical protein [Polyangia bacterium]